MPLQFILSQKGKNLLKHDGYLHCLQRRNKSCCVWKCSDSRKKSCPGLVYSTSDTSEGVCQILNFVFNRIGLRRKFKFQILYRRSYKNRRAHISSTRHREQ